MRGILQVRSDIIEKIEKRLLEWYGHVTRIDKVTGHQSKCAHDLMKGGRENVDEGTGKGRM